VVETRLRPERLGDATFSVGMALSAAAEEEKGAGRFGEGSPFMVPVFLYSLLHPQKSRAVGYGSLCFFVVVEFCKVE
jgi:hypothetical protein